MEMVSVSLQAPGEPAFAGHYSALLGQPELGSG